MSDIKASLRVSTLWENFKNEIIYDNRFFPKYNNVFLDQLDKIIPMLRKTVRTGSVWYRAREYSFESPTVFSHEDLMLLPEDKRKKEKDLLDESSLLNIINIYFNYSEKMDVIKSFAKESERIAERERTSIWGYDKKESGMPPRDKAGLNRASPRYIPYLYLAKDSKTALAEARALPNQRFSVAKYKTKRKLNIVNLTQWLGENATDEEITIGSKIYMTFSSPSQSDEKDYLVSQFIAEYIKNCDYDGISFYSSRKRIHATAKSKIGSYSSYPKRCTTLGLRRGAFQKNSKSNFQSTQENNKKLA